MDIAPRYGGILYGISNTVANVPGFLAPQVAGWILDKENVSFVTLVTYLTKTRQ